MRGMCFLPTRSWVYFFDDPTSIWPPPAENSHQKDLFQIMHAFSLYVKQAFLDLQGESSDGRNAGIKNFERQGPGRELG